MGRIELSKKTIDPVTGSDVIEKRVFKLPADADPTTSIVFHKTADLLGVKVFDRTNPHLYRKLAVLYNWASEKARSNDPEKVYDTLDKYRSKLGLNVIGSELVDAIYRTIRLDLSRGDDEAEYEETKRGIDNINQEFKADAKRSKEIKSERRKGEKTQEALSNRAAERGEIILQAWKDSLIKEKNIKIKVIKDDHLEERQEVL